MSSSPATPIPCDIDLPPRVLVVDDEPSLCETIEDAVRDGMKCRVISVANIAEAKKILLSQSVQLLVTDVNLPDGDGTTLLPMLQQHHTSASAIVMTGSPSLARAVSAMREGAFDFVSKPFTHQQITESLRSGLDRQARAFKQEKRFDRLKSAVKRLNESRRLISQKVDLLCNDLVIAYGELSRQLDDVRTQEGFRKFIAGATDLEQLLCHAMDWMLRQFGYCNVAVYLAGEDGDFQLGAYMKYTLTGDALLTDALRRVLVPPINRESSLHANAGVYASQFTPAEAQLMKGQDILGISCTYLGETLATLMFFRDSRTPFTTDDQVLLNSISAIFAISLASVVREVRDDDGHNDGGGAHTDDSDQYPPDAPDGSARPRKDPADWWKRGGENPY